MATKILPALLFSLLLSCDAAPNYDVKLSNVFFNGGFLLLPVKRTKVQERLNELNCQFHNDDVKLYLPSEPVLQDLIACDEHVVMIGFGTDESVAIENALSDEEQETESPIFEGLGISIPYLTTKNEEQKGITVQMKLFTAECGHHTDANIGLAAPIIADQFSKTINGTSVEIQLRKGDFELHIVGERPEPCASNGQHEIQEVQEYERELQISLSGPDFSICDNLPDLQVDLCDVYRNPEYNQILKQAKNNVCQYWEATDDVQNTKITFHVESISPSMREYLLLDENQDVLEGELQSGTFDVRMVFPCFE